MRTLLLFVPSLGFGLIALVFSALALDLGEEDSSGRAIRNRVATWTAVGAAILCALSLLGAAGILVLEVTPGD